MRVLLAEDEAELAGYVAEGLREQAMAVDIAGDGTTALDKLSVTQYDVLVLDRDLPGTHGDDVCRKLTADGARTRILMLTALGDVRDRVTGLGLGADDYLAKPFDFDELVARINALGRRAQPALPPVLRAAGLELDPALHQVLEDGRYVPLSKKEFGVLHSLMAARGRVVSAEELLSTAWDEFADPFTNAVRTTVCRLRAKLRDPGLVETIPGAGYRIADTAC